MTANETLNQVTNKEQGLSFAELLHRWHKGDSLFTSDIERIVEKAMKEYASQPPLTDKEIEKEAPYPSSMSSRNAFVLGAKWHRDQSCINQSQWTDGDIDASYLMGIINGGSADVPESAPFPSLERVQIELERLKKTGFDSPHEAVRKLRYSNKVKPF